MITQSFKGVRTAGTDQGKPDEVTTGYIPGHILLTTVDGVDPSGRSKSRTDELCPFCFCTIMEGSD